MKAPRSACCFAPLASSSQPQPRLTLGILQADAGLAQVIALVEGHQADTRRCPRCNSARLYRHGHANDLQRFRCRQCGRTFNDLSGTPLARLRLRGKWSGYVETLLASTSIRAAASAVGIHRNVLSLASPLPAPVQGRLAHVPARHCRGRRKRETGARVRGSGLGAIHVRHGKAYRRGWRK